MKTELITSAANPLLRDLRRAVSRGELSGDGLWIAEGFHLFEEALGCGDALRTVLVSESAQPRLKPGAPRTIVLPDALFATIAATETSQGVMALVRPPVWTAEQVLGVAGVVVVLDGLQDPGNAGTIVRAAEAFGAAGVVFVKGSAGPWHPKTLRASSGSLFRVPFLAGMEASAVCAALTEHTIHAYAAMPFTGSETLAEDADFRRHCALVIGSEGRGIGPELRAISQPVAIPTAGVESLNAAVAAAVLLYESRRQWA